MPKYSRRLTGLSDIPNDFVFRYNGHDVGRCYLREMSGSSTFWSWTIFIGWTISKIPDDIPVSGAAETIERAQEQFRASFDRLIAAGAVRMDRLGQ
jgi:hypothetical protein